MISMSSLTSTQQIAAANIIRALTGAGPREKLLVVLVGLSGVGKDTVVQAIKENIIHLGGNSASINFIDSENFTPEAQHLVTTATPREVYHADWAIRRPSLKDYRVVQIILPGMSRVEFNVFEKILTKKGIFTTERLFELSHGIPLLALRIARFAEDLKKAEEISLSYLLSSAVNDDKDKGFYNRYLRIPLTVEEVEKVTTQLSENRTQRGLYVHSPFHDGLDDVIENLAQLELKSEQVEESPVFRSEESKLLWDAVVSRGDEIGSETTVKILIPNLDRADYERILESMNHEHKGHDCRLEAFNAELSKITLYGIKPSGAEFFWTNDSDEAISRRIAERSMQDFLSGELPIIPSPRNDRYRLFVMRWAHPGGYFQSIDTAWALETLLQHRNIAYLVDNFMARKRYYYVPAGHKIVTFGGAPKLFFD